MGMPIDVQTGSSFLLSIQATSFPQMGRLGAKRDGQRFGPLGLGELTQKPFGVAIAIGPTPSGDHCQRVSGVSSQVMRSAQAAHRQEQQRQQQLATALWGTRKQRPSGGLFTRGERRFQIGEQTRHLGGCQQ
jgi:hypothetical protein